MSDPFEKSLQGSSEFLPFKNMQESLYGNASLCGESEKVSLDDAIFARRQYERDQQDFKKLKQNMAPIQQQSQNQFLNVGKWRDKRDKQLDNELKKLKIKANALQSSIFGKSQIFQESNNFNTSKVQVKNQSRASKWDKKKSTQLQEQVIQAYKNQDIKVQQEKIKKIDDCIEQRIYTEEQKKEQCASDQQIEDQTQGQNEQQQQQEQEQQQQQQQQQQEDQDEQQQEEQEQVQEQQQQNQQDLSQQNSSNMQKSNSSCIAGQQQSQKSWYQKKQKGNRSIAQTDPQYKTEIMNDTVTTNNRPFSKWAKKETQTGMKTEIKTPQQVKNLSTQLMKTKNIQKKQQIKNIPKNWYNIQKILLRINKLVSQ